MNIILRILVILAGIVLILPGLCTLGFGGFFTFAGGLQNGGAVFGIPMIVVGGLFTWVGWLLISQSGKQ